MCFSKKKRDDRFANREHSHTHLYSNGQANSSLGLIASLLNASIIAICIVALIEDQKVDFMIFSYIILAFIAFFCELIPKILASKYLECWKTFMAKPVFLILWLAKPLGAMSDFISNKIILSLIPNKLEPEEVT